MRLFIAINLPENIKEYLRKIQVLLPEAKMSRTHDFHMTFKFLGSCDEARLKKIEEELVKASASFKSFQSQLTSIGTFGGRYPRVIWIGISAPDWLKDFARDIENRVAKFGFEKENRFAPHITLARIKEITNPEKFSEELKKIPLEPLKFEVRKFYLFESQLSPKGAVHIKLREYSSTL